MAIDIISGLVERSQTDEVTEGELVGPEPEELVAPEHEATQGEAKVEGTKSGKEEGSTRQAPHLREPPKER